MKAYNELAEYYDKIYHWKDYEKESKKLIELIEKNNPPGKTLLDVACGTGTHLSYLKEKYDCVGLDNSKKFLEIARAKLPDLKFVKANMMDFDLGKKFDIITCLFSAIGHVKTYKNLEKTIKNFSSHLKKNGVLIIEPWFSKEKYKVGRPFMTTYDGDKLKIARMNISKLDKNLSVLDMHFLIAEEGKEVKHIRDKIKLGLFDTEKTLEILNNAGFKAEFLKQGLMEDRGLFLGIKE